MKQDCLMAACMPMMYDYDHPYPYPCMAACMPMMYNSAFDQTPFRRSMQRHARIDGVC